jgi:hypothetical protein
LEESLKRITLLALSATVAMAEAPVAANTAATEATETSSAPLAPIHDDLVFGNPALPKSIAWVLVAPSDLANQRAAAFQWNGGASTFAGTGVAILDQYFGAFDANGNQGELVGGYTTTKFGAGLRTNFRKTSFSSDTVNATPRVVEQDSTFAPTSIGAFGSMPFGDLTVFAHVDWGTPNNYGSVTNKSRLGEATTTTNSSNRSDEVTLGLGAATEAKGDRGLSWNSDLELGYYRDRTDQPYSTYTLDLVGNIGKSFSADKFILAPGLQGKLGYWNGRGGDNINFAAGHQFRGDADYGYSFGLVPNLATVLPVFTHWTIEGCAFAGFEYLYEDALRGDKSNGYGLFQSTGPGGSVGVRYERGRWAAEAQVLNGFLSRGPYFLSGSGGNMLASFALTLNLK